MERKELFEEMLQVIEELQSKQEEKVIEEDMLSGKWGMINPIILQITKDVYSDINFKNAEQRDSEIKFRKYNTYEVQETLAQIDKLNSSIKKLDIEIEFLQNKFKCYKVAYGGSGLI